MSALKKLRTITQEALRHFDGINFFQCPIKPYVLAVRPNLECVKRGCYIVRDKTSRVKFSEGKSSYVAWLQAAVVVLSVNGMKPGE